jgi:hypothetical protein
MVDSLILATMNKAKDKSVAHAVRSRVERGGTDRLWTYADFDVSDRMALAAALSRLVGTGELVRVRRGVYYRPKATVVGPSRPDPEALVDAAIRARNATPIPSGIGEYNRLGLTTQASAVVSRATPRRVRRDFLGGIIVRASERPLDAQVGIRSEERTALEALRDILRIPDTRPTDVLRRLLALFRSGELTYGRVAHYALAEPPRVRALIGALGDELRASGAARRAPAQTVEALRASLNPLTYFAVPGASDVLRSAPNWRIRPGR